MEAGLHYRLPTISALIERSRLNGTLACSAVIPKALFGEPRVVLDGIRRVYEWAVNSFGHDVNFLLFARVSIIPNV